MFLCKDISQRYLLAAYWERGEFLVVIKEMLANRDLVEFVAMSFLQSDAKLLMQELLSGPAELHGVHFDALTATAIAGRVAEGLRTPSKEGGRAAKSASRIRPEHWG